MFYSKIFFFDNISKMILIFIIEKKKYIEVVFSFEYYYRGKDKNG